MLSTPTLDASTRALQALALRVPRRNKLAPVPNHVNLAPSTFRGPSLRLDEMRTYRRRETPDRAPAEAYLHIRYPTGGRDYLIPLEDHATLDPARLVREFLGRVRGIGERIGAVTRRTSGGDITWTIHLDGEDPHAAHCWASGGAWTRGRREPARV